MGICENNIKGAPVYSKTTAAPSTEKVALCQLVCKINSGTLENNAPCSSSAKCEACYKACGTAPTLPPPVTPLLCNNNDFANYAVKWQNQLSTTYDGILADITTFA